VERKETSGEKNAGAGEQEESLGSFWPRLAPVLFLTLLFFINFIGRIILSPLLPTIEKELQISHGQAGFLFFLISLGYIIGLLGSGFFASHFTHKFTVIVSCAGVGLSLLSNAAANSLLWMQLGLCGLGLAAGLYMPSAIATITSLVDRRHWGKAIGVHELAPNLAFFIGPFAAELFLRWSTWRAGLGFLGAVSVLMSLVYARWGRGGDFPGDSPKSDAFKILLSTPSFWLMSLLFGLGVSSTLGVFAMIPLYLVSERGIDQTWANTIVALSRSYGPLLGLMGGWVSDRLGHKRTMAVSLFFTGIATLFLGSVPTDWITAAVLFQPMLAVWFFPASFVALSMITLPTARNLAVAFTIPIGYVFGAGVIPTFVGVMGDIGSFALGFSIAGALICCGGVLALLLRLPDHDKKVV